MRKETENEKLGIELFLNKINVDVSKSFKQLHSEIMKDSELSRKDKILIAVASSVAIRCDECLRYHTKEALKNGLRIEELLEAVSVAALVCTGSRFNHASIILEVDEEVS